MNIVMTAYFNGRIDPQRGIKWAADPAALQPLVDSLKTNLVLFTDCLQDYQHPKVIVVDAKLERSPYLQRWFSYYYWLLEHPEFDKVFCVDATDVEMLRSPFANMDDRIYVGDEDQYLGTPWVIENHSEPFMRDFFTAARRKKLLNIGLLGAHRELMLSVLEQFIDYASRYEPGQTDMGIFNYLFYTRYKGRVTHGQPVNTIFKKFEKETPAWFRHK